MKHIPYKQAHVFRRGTGDINQEPVVAVEYPTGNPNINIAEVTLRKRYPESGDSWSVNDEATMEVYVAGGEGFIVTEASKTAIAQGDVVQIPPGELYYWLPLGQLVLIPASHPAWHPEQHRTVVK